MLRSQDRRLLVVAGVAWVGLLYILVLRPAGIGIGHKQPSPVVKHLTTTNHTSNSISYPDSAQGLDQYTTLFKNYAYTAKRDPMLLGLQNLCNRTTWQPNLYWSCMDNHSGLQNVQNMILNCVRYAIESGAVGLVIPSIHQRDSTRLANLNTHHYTTLDHLFDLDWFKQSLSASCPQIRLLPTHDSIPNFAWAKVSDPVDPTEINKENPSGNFSNANAKTWRADYNAYLDKVGPKPTKDQPYVWRMRQVHPFSWAALALDDRELNQALGSILAYRPELVGFARNCSERLSRLGRSAKYLGLHLRTEGDTPKFWPKYREIADAALQIAAKEALNIIFVATGDESSFRTFRAECKAKNIAVFWKWDLIDHSTDSRELEWFQRYTFDQQAELDYLLLLDSAQFVGSGESSFSYQLAIRRSFMRNDAIYQSSHDAASTTVGRVFQYYDSIWP